MTIQLCTNTPIPTFNQLYQSLLDAIANLPNPIESLSIPNIPPLRNPIFDGKRLLSLELSQIVQALQTWQLNLTIKAILDPLVSIIGGGIDDLLPKIPHLDLGLLDILSMNTTEIYQQIKQKIMDGVEFPFIPSPLFASLSIPSVEIVTMVKMILSNYMMLVIQEITSIIDQVVGILRTPFPNLPSLPTLPTIPSLEQIKAMILAAFPDFDSIEDALRSGLSVSDLFAVLHIDGFPNFILPKPLLPNFSSFDLELSEAFSIMYADLSAALVGKLVDFVDSVLSMLSFEFPTICITF